MNEKVEKYAETTSSSLEELDEKYQNIKSEIKKINLKKSENQNSGGQSGLKVYTFFEIFLVFITEDQSQGRYTALVRCNVCMGQMVINGATFRAVDLENLETLVKVQRAAQGRVRHDNKIFVLSCHRQ